MLETALVILIASGLWFMSQRWRKPQSPRLPLSAESWQNASVLAYAGLFSLSTPYEQAHYAAFRDLRFTDTALVLIDNRQHSEIAVNFAAIQWVNAIRLPQEGIAEITIHLEIAQRWRILSLEIPQAEMAVLQRILRQVIPSSRLNLDRALVSPIGPLSARITEDSLQGESNLGAEISLYLLPQLLVVLHDDVVKAKIDVSSIRRVLAVEKLSGRLDSLIKPNQTEGVLRLYSLYETAAFALPQYRELAEEISYLARCPIEFISQEDKSNKA